MIRWRFVLSRLIVVIVILVLVRVGLGPVARYVTVAGLQSMTGAKVEIAETSVGIFPPRLQYRGIAVADPREDKSMRNAVQADSVELVLDGEALMHRRWVANSGRITGLRIDSGRDASGHFDRNKEAQPTSPINTEPSWFGKLIRSTAGRLGDQTSQAIDDLETVRKSKEIRARWEIEYETLVQRAKLLEIQVEMIRDGAKGVDNPLRDWPELERTLAQARAARNELLSVRKAIDELPDRFQADLLTLQLAKQADLAKVQRYLPVDLAQTEDFGVAVLSQSIREQIKQVQEYVQSGRQIAEYTVVAPESERQRGADYDLLDTHRPQLMIRQCEISGLLSSGGQSYALSGIVDNLTPSPELLAEPTRARLRLEGPHVMRLEYVRDRRKGVDVDLVTMHWPEMEAQRLQLGNDHEASILVDGGKRELWIQLRCEGDQLQGRLVSKRTDLNMQLAVSPEYHQLPLVQSLQQSLSAVDKIEIDAGFQGNWKEMDLHVKSNLAPVFGQATKDAVAGQVAASKAKMIAEIEQVYDEQTAQLRDWLGTQQNATRDLLAGADQSIEEMSQKVLDEVGNADAYLGKLRSAIRGNLR